LQGRCRIAIVCRLNRKFVRRCVELGRLTLWLSFVEGLGMELAAKMCIGVGDLLLGRQGLGRFVGRQVLLALRLSGGFGFRQLQGLSGLALALDRAIWSSAIRVFNRHHSISRADKQQISRSPSIRDCQRSATPLGARKSLSAHFLKKHITLGILSNVLEIKLKSISTQRYFRDKTNILPEIF
jgi:hypothetical protein